MSDQDIKIEYYFRQLGNAIGSAETYTDTLWAFLHGKVDFSSREMGYMYEAYGQMLYYLDLLEKSLSSLNTTDKDRLRNLTKRAMGVKATHDVLYENEGNRMSELLKGSLEERIGFFENSDETIGDRLNTSEEEIESLNEDSEDYPITVVLWDRDEVEWVLVALEMLQAKGKYTDLELDNYKDRMKRADVMLQEKVFECLKHYLECHYEEHPDAPAHFWWRHDLPTFQG